MLNQPTIDKLCAMRMRGMAEALQQQMQEPDIHQLSFEERLGLLIDRQWDWRQNRALADPAIGLGRSPSESLSGGSNRNRQNLAGACDRAEGLPRRLLGAVPESRRVIPRPGRVARRRQPLQASLPTRPR